MFLIFDTETTGLPIDKNAPLTDFGNWPRMVQLAWQIHDEKGVFVESHNHIIRPDGFEIPINATMVHHITTKHAMEVGEPLEKVLDVFLESAKKAKYLVGHNVSFDLSVLGCEFLRVKGVNCIEKWLYVDTCTEKTANFCKVSKSRNRYKLPSLAEIYNILFGNDFDSAHNASADVCATARVFLELLRLGVINHDEIKEEDSFFTKFKEANPYVVQSANIEVISNESENSNEDTVEPESTANDIKTFKFTHLHVHSHYSILDGLSKIPDLVDKCLRTGMTSMALTDHGNMFGIKEFADYVDNVNNTNRNKIKELEKKLEDDDLDEEKKVEIQNSIDSLRNRFFKPIFGIEAYCAPVSIEKRESRSDSGWHLILLAKNKTGYKNLCKLSSLSYIDGLYYKPRIDHSLLEQYKEGLIVCSACLGGEVPQKIMNGDFKGAEESVLWFKSLFGDDYYLELQRHKTDKEGGDREVYERQKEVNKVLLELSEKHGVKVVATNDVHFVEEEHAEAHDRLICVSTQKKLDESRLRYTKQEWLKSPEEMSMVFADIPEALLNTQEIADKVESYSINSNPYMPVFDIPEEFGTEESYRERYTEKDLFNEFTRDEHGNVVMTEDKALEKIDKLGGYDRLYRIKLEADYLAKLAWEGAKMRYGEELSDELKERIIFELHIMKTMGFPGYFLIVYDYIRVAREELGVSVGPGRGSAAGSVVAYCLRITDIDPIKYNLLFERFLNPDRISLPDIDVDFDDDGRGRVLDWIVKKYGKEKVAHIITFGTMASKSAIADVGKVQGVPREKVNLVKSYIPEKSFPENIKDSKGKSPKVNIKNCCLYVPEIKALVEGDDENISSMLKYAQELEDTNRQVGIHACGVIIGSQDLTNLLPLSVIEDKKTKEKVVVTQYDGHFVESVGLIKMDFLGLKTLTQIKGALANIKQTHGIDLDIDHIPIDDKETYRLYSSGNTIGTFQFESPGMQKYLKELKPTVFEDLVAMNALYRPGPMEYIPDFIARKQGRAPIEYPIKEMETYLKDTYGITVYQEQVMQLSRLLASFTRGESDTLRKAMGKKDINKMLQLKDKFITQGEKNGHDREVLEKIWKDWEKFASYAFNKSHATCYSWVSYQTAYLKAHYPAEFMAAVLNSGINDGKEITLMTEECRRMRIDVLPPDVNESDYSFIVNKDGKIVFGLGGIKGVGEISTVIREERDKNGKYKSFTDFMMRVGAKDLNKNILESLIKAGALDCFKELHRAAYFYIAPGEKVTFLEKSIKMANTIIDRKNAAQIDLFGFQQDDVNVGLTLPIPQCERWAQIKELENEKEVIGFFMSAHPLDTFRKTIELFADNIRLEELDDIIRNRRGAKIKVAGFVTMVEHKISLAGKQYGRFRIEDDSGGYEFSLFSEKYKSFCHYLDMGSSVLLTGEVRELYRKKDNNSDNHDNVRDNANEFFITDVQLLESLLANTNRKVKLVVDVNKLDSERCKELIKIVKNNKGKQHFSVAFVDDENNMSCMMNAQKGGVNAETLFEFLDKLDYVKYELLK